jgi:hypothetical protein
MANKTSQMQKMCVRNLAAEGRGIREIARLTELARNTVRGILRGRPVVGDPSQAKHGTLTGYTYHRCRCVDCSAVQKAYMARAYLLRPAFKPGTCWRPTSRPPLRLDAIRQNGQSLHDLIGGDEWDDPTFNAVAARLDAERRYERMVLAEKNDEARSRPRAHRPVPWFDEADMTIQHQRSA